MEKYNYNGQIYILKDGSFYRTLENDASIPVEEISLVGLSASDPSQQTLNILLNNGQLREISEIAVVEPTTTEPTTTEPTTSAEPVVLPKIYVTDIVDADENRIYYDPNQSTPEEIDTGILSPKQYKNIEEGKTRVGDVEIIKVSEEQLEALVSDKKQGKDPCKVPESTTTGKKIIQADPCKDNTFARIEAYLTNFFDKITQVGNAILNLPNEIKSVVNLIGNTITGFVNKMLGSLSDALSGLIKKGIGKFVEYLKSLDFGTGFIVEKLTPLTGLVKKLFDGLFCAATKVMEGALDVMEELITGAVKNVLNAGSCVVEQIVGAFTNNLVNIVDSIAGPLLGPITKILEPIGFIFKIKDFLLTGINAVRKIANLFECDEKKICPASSKYIIDKGLFKDKSEEDEESAFNRIFSGTAISQGAENLVGDFEEKYGKWTVFGAPLSEASNLGPCDFGNVSQCGLPTVSFFGGDGLGAAGSVILGKIINNVDTEDAVGSVIKVGSIVGVEMTNPGQSYTRAPLVTFQDSCNKGYGGYGRAIIDQNPSSPTFGQVTSVVITSEGENYPADISELPLYIVDVIIENPGQDYQDDDIVVIPDAPDTEEPVVDIEIVDGRVTRVDVKEGFAFNGLPDLNIESSTGFGAVLRPIMSIVQPDRQDGQGEIIQVIDCVS